MIFVTVGHQMPFARLVRPVDRWAGERDDVEVFAQIGVTEFRPSHIEWTASLPPDEFERRVREASCVVAHAGMGTILTALRLAVPILVLPRRAELRETRSDHQLATVQRFQSIGRVRAAMDEDQLIDALDAIGSLEPGAPIAAHASPQLLRTLRHFIDGASGAE